MSHTDVRGEREREKNKQGSITVNFNYLITSRDQRFTFLPALISLISDLL